MLALSETEGWLTLFRAFSPILNPFKINHF
jgi:hypothetical protein